MNQFYFIIFGYNLSSDYFLCYYFKVDQHHLLGRSFYKDWRVQNIVKLTFASFLIGQGENLKYIQSQLGHSSPTVTMNVYAHLMKSTNQEAACRLETRFLGKLKDRFHSSFHIVIVNSTNLL